MKTSGQPWRDLAARYRAAFAAAWAARATMQSPGRRRDELEFLPSHLALIETPVSPLPSWSMRAIALMVALGFCWACLGRLDIVAVAGGRMVSSSRTKVIQPTETAVVSAILVRDGQYVTAGQLLLTLETVGADADDRQARDTLATAMLAAARHRALADAVQQGRPPRLPTLPGIEPARLAAEQALTDGQWQAYRARHQALEAAIAQRTAEAATVRALISKLTRTLEIARARERDFLDLARRQFVSRHAYLDKQQQRIERQSDLAAQQSHLAEIGAALARQRQEHTAHRAEFRQTALDQLRDADARIQQFQQESRKTAWRRSQRRLTAPVSGTIQQLAVHTVGGVVTAAQPLMAVVPDGDVLEVEARVENKDIGFIRPGQPAVIKVESFPYTRYGHLNGVVDSVSQDALLDERLGWVFQMRIRLARDTLTIDGSRVALRPGMAVQAEIKTGRRRVISYFLSPLQEHAGESLRER